MKTPREVALEALDMGPDHPRVGERADKWNTFRSVEAAIAAERQRADELQRTFDLRWKADMRAIKAWQAETGKHMTWPDRADMTLWLLNKVDRMVAALSTIAEATKGGIDQSDDALEAMIAKVRQTAAAAFAEHVPHDRPLPQKVWVATIDHRHGTDTSPAFRTRESAVRWLAEFAREWWDEVRLEGPAPEDDEAAFTAYFDRQREVGDEWYVLNELEVVD